MKSNKPPAKLISQWRFVVGVYLVVWLAGYFWLLSFWQELYAKRWLGLAGMLLCHPLLLSRLNLTKNLRVGETTILPAFGSGNLLTLTRGLMLGLMGGFLLNPPPPGFGAWLPAILYTGVALADIFDGYLARRANHATQLGVILDIEIDALSVLLVTALAIWLGNLPAVMLALGFARYLYMLGLHWRTRKGLPIAALPDSRFRRIVAGLYMSFLTVTLWPPVQPPGSWVAAAVYAPPVAAIFIRDWLVASGKIDPSSAKYRRYWIQPARLIAVQLPLFLRFVPAIYLLFAAFAGYSADWQGFWQQFTAAPTMILSPELIPWLNAIVAVGAMCIAAGILPHFTATIPLIAAVADILTVGLNWHNAVLLMVCCLLTILGGGNYALWSPEEGKLFKKRLGDS